MQKCEWLRECIWRIDTGASIFLCEVATMAFFIHRIFIFINVSTHLFGFRTAGKKSHGCCAESNRDYLHSKKAAATFTAVCALLLANWLFTIILAVGWFMGWEAMRGILCWRRKSSGQIGVANQVGGLRSVSLSSNNACVRALRPVLLLNT